MTARLPSAPPTLPGFTFVRVLGSGGFADVFLYEENFPRRLVAVKVMLADIVSEEVRAAFRAEADLSAQLSAHPSVLTVHQAGVSADGRPYLVMEHCVAGPAQRFRTEPLPVTAALATTIRIAAAVETAHRNGVLHRDIKPSNILTTAFGHPVLGDFGIAATIDETDVSDSLGLSIPWSAPEVLRGDVSGTIASEVWSLGATAYSLLAGRSPFEGPELDNSSAALIARVRRGDPPPTGRSDVPASLEGVLRRSMSRVPDERYPGALAFLRDLQAVEVELGLEPTVAELAIGEWIEDVAGDRDDPTVRSVADAVPAGGASRTPRSPVRMPRKGPKQATPVPDTSRMPLSAVRRRRNAPLWISVGLAAALLIGAVGGALLVGAAAELDLPAMAGLIGDRG
ncbi:serine/threonine-protein kinase [Agromyces archimandritae]|uniref:non-specific serine/threonine protein kinase n=1 Tax=Agromyces archimandritae TaxID=2781962 RepID=A0A975FNE1_9MICO|nr:serine/threonine-protein kinase [Agromyces archimandritae]QTX05141.1 serine/threonine protein kinase [Agromyces archimandritae]